MQWVCKRKERGNCVREIPGLCVYPEWISDIEERGLLSYFYDDEEEKLVWNDTIGRRTIQYGYRYKYDTKTLEKDVPGIPIWLAPLANRVQTECDLYCANLSISAGRLNQVIVNEYTKGQAIGPHIDNPRFFGPVVVTLTLGESVPVRFGRLRSEVHVPAPRRSMMVLAGDSRYRWTHSLRMDKEGTRVSVTFRSVE